MGRSKTRCRPNFAGVSSSKHKIAPNYVFTPRFYLNLSGGLLQKDYVQVRSDTIPPPLSRPFRGRSRRQLAAAAEAHQYTPPATKDHRGIQACGQQWRVVDCRSRGEAGSESNGGWSKVAGCRGRGVSIESHAWRPVNPQMQLFDGSETPMQTPCERSEGGYM